MRRKTPKYYLNTLWLYALRGYYYGDISNSRLKDRLKGGEAKVEGDFNSKYISFSHFSSAANLESSIKFDSNNIAITNVELRTSKINPLFPAYWALVCWNEYLINGRRIEDFQKNTDYLLRSFVPYKDVLVFPYETAHQRYKTSGYWYSGICQAMSISALLRKKKLESTNEFDDIIEGLVQSLTISVNKGGVLYNSDFGPWISEYPSENPPLVLNGFMFSIIALIEYAIVFKDKNYVSKSNLFLETLINVMPKFIFKKGVKYCLKEHKISNVEYQILYPSLFKHLFALTNFGIFQEMEQELKTLVSQSAFESFYGIKH